MSFFTNEITQSKLQILYFLYLTNLELTADQIARVSIENDWDQYFGVTQSLAELSNNSLLAMITRPIGQVYCISEAGKSAMKQFLPRLANSKQTQVETYAKENKNKIINASSHIASYSMINENEFCVEFKIIESDITLMTLSLNVVSREIAKELCKRWKDCAQNVYKKTINELFK